MNQPRLIRLDEVCRLTGLHRTTIYQRISRGKFPKPVPIADTKRVGWLSDEVSDWINACVAARDSHSQPAE